MSSEALSSSDYVSPQTLVDLCTLQGWAAVWVTNAAGSSLQGGHVHVFYKKPGATGSGGSRMIWADQRGVQQIEELRRELEAPGGMSQRVEAIQGRTADFIVFDAEYSA
jgi:hypothetical protein